MPADLYAASCKPDPGDAPVVLLYVLSGGSDLYRRERGGSWTLVASGIFGYYTDTTVPTSWPVGTIVDYYSSDAPLDLTSERAFVARYRDGGRLVAIHLDTDSDYADRLAEAHLGLTPPEGGYYRIFPPAEASL